MLLKDFVKSCAVGFPTKVAFIDRDKARTWSEIDQRTDAFAAVLQRFGLRNGDVCGILGHNRIELPEQSFACAKSGAVRVGLNWRYSAADMIHAIHDSNARVIVMEAACLAPLAGVLDQLRAEGRILIGYGPDHGLEHDYEELIARNYLLEAPEIKGSDIAMIGYTSGSTGKPKGVLMTHDNVMSSLLNISIAYSYSFDDVRYYCTNPAGVNITTMCCNVVTGMTTVLEDFDDDQLLLDIKRHGITQLTLVSTMVRRLVDLVKARGGDIKPVRQIAYGAMPTSPALIREAIETLGCELIQLYGASEAGGQLVALRHSDHLRAINGEPQLLRSAGRAMPWAEISIRDDDGNPLPAGEMGTVWLKSKGVFAGYLNLPAETAEGLCPPWHRTGDYGRLDDHGYLFLGDRKKHMIISGGMNIYPTAVEEALTAHPAVHQAVVTGVPHRDWGEAVVAAVTLHGPDAVSAASLIAHCKATLAKWEVPKHISVRANLPTGYTDKLNRDAVRQSLIEELGDSWS